MNDRRTRRHASRLALFLALALAIGCMDGPGPDRRGAEDKSPDESASAALPSPEETLEVGRNVNVEHGRRAIRDALATPLDGDVDAVEKVRDGTLRDFSYTGANGTVFLIGSTGAVCTGQVLNGRFIVTAAHCFAGTPSLLPGFSAQLEVRNVDANGNPITLYRGGAVAWQQPNWQHSNKDLALIFLADRAMQTCQQDFAFCHSLVPGLPVNAFFQWFPDGVAPKWFGSYEFAGYGSTDDTFSDGLLRSGTMTTCCPPLWGPAHSGDGQGFGYLMSWNNSPRPCRGDSGGPLIAPISVGRPVYSGILSQGLTTCVDPNGTAAYTGLSNAQAGWLWDLVHNVKAYLGITFDCGVRWYQDVYMLGCDDDGSVY